MKKIARPCGLYQAYLSLDPDPDPDPELPN